MKNVLTYCGFDNVHTISEINENDLEYCTTVVRKGGIINYFSNEVGSENALQGSHKSEANFEFSRGHQKLIMAIVKLVKQNLNENGVDAFLVKLPKSMKNRNASTKVITESRKETKDMTVSTLKEKQSTQIDSTCSFHDNLINLQAKLLKQIIQSLFIHTSDMYEEVSTFKLSSVHDPIFLTLKVSGFRIWSSSEPKFAI